MKTLRLLTIILVAVLLFSTWAPAYAKTASSPTTAVELAKTKLARLRVNNQTGGTLYVSFASSARGYSFSTSKEGRTTFDSVIQPGKYTITVRASACGGQLTFRKNVKGGTVGLPTIVCKRK